MGKIYVLPRHLRMALAKPMGPHFAGAPEISLPKALQWLQGHYPDAFSPTGDISHLQIICVGDIISKAMIDHPILHKYLKMCFVDDLTQRGTVIDWQDSCFSRVTLKNPRGAIAEEIFEFIRSHNSSSEQFLVKIDGEEDLLVIPAVLLSPSSTVVFYGQPPMTDLNPPLVAGCVAIPVTIEIKTKLQAIFSEFAIEDQ
jgi:uncharacterized protein (UPF0218 family)